MSKYNIYSAQEIDEKLDVLEQKFSKKEGNKALKIRTLPPKEGEVFVSPIVTPLAVQGEFPQYKNSENTTNLSQFSQETVAQIEAINLNLEENIVNVVSEKIGKEGGIPLPGVEEIDVSVIETTIKENIEKTIIQTLYPIGSTVTVFDSEFDPNENTNSIKKALGSTSEWILVETEELLSVQYHIKTFSYSGNGYVKDVLIIDGNILNNIEQEFVHKYGALSEGQKYLQIQDPDTDNHNICRTNFSITCFNEHWASGNWEIYGVMFNNDENKFYIRANPLGSTDYPLYLNIGIFTSRPRFIWKRVS